ncbi:MAG: hypothetical protein WKG07_10460 [Hymenobacter sp.]
MLKDRHTEARYVVDSFPVAVCHNTRIPRCKLLTRQGLSRPLRQQALLVLRPQSPGRGHRVTGVPVEFHLHAGAEADQHRPARRWPLDLPVGQRAPHRCGLHGLRRPRTYSKKRAAAASKRARRKKTASGPTIRHQNFLIQYFRKGIETRL